MTTVIVTAIISCCVSFFLGGVLTFLVARVKGLFNREKALTDGVRSLLRNKIIEYHEKYTRQGFCPIYAKEAARSNYEAYHALGGNGVITKLFNDIMALPESKKEIKTGGQK